MQEDLVSLESLMGHLEPSSDDLKAMQQNAAKQLVEAVSKIGVVSLVSKAPQVSLPKTAVRVLFSAEAGSDSPICVQHRRPAVADPCEDNLSGKRLD